MTPPLDFCPQVASSVRLSDFDMEDVKLSNDSHTVFNLDMDCRSLCKFTLDVMKHLEFHEHKTRTGLIVLGSGMTKVWSPEFRAACAVAGIAPRRLTLSARTAYKSLFPSDFLLDVYLPEESVQSNKHAVASLVRLEGSDYIYRPHFRITLR